MELRYLRYFLAVAEERNVRYHPQSKSGVWYRYIDKASAVGLLDQTDLKLLAEIMRESG
jgi:hypothetical protein